MTERENETLKELTGSFNDLRIEVVKHMAGEVACRQQVSAIHAEVFGVDGDPTRPGLKGQMRDVKNQASQQRAELDDIHAKYRGGLSKLWLLVTTGAGAVIGAYAKHLFQ